MTRRKVAKAKAREAEVAAEHYLVSTCGCVETRRTIRARFQKVDFWYCDVVGKTKDGAHYYVQVTTGSYANVSQRRRKLETIPWHKSDTVILLHLVSNPDPDNKRRKLWQFRVHFYLHQEEEWRVETERVVVPREWFKTIPKD